MMKEHLQAVLSSITAFSEEEMGQITACFKPKTAVKGIILLNQGETCREFYVVSKGCIRTYFVDRNGNEKTRYIMPENYIGTALTSFVSQTPSFEYIDVLSDSELLAISHADFYRLNDELEQWKTFYQRILEMAYSFQNRKIEAIVTLSAQQRFEKTMKENPDLFQLLSNKVLASYLDMSPETLSRLKSR